MPGFDEALRASTRRAQASSADHVTSVDWSPKNYTLATGGWDRRFRLWQMSPEQVALCRTQRCRELAPRRMARHPQLLWSVAFAPEGWHVAACHGAVGQSPSVVVYEVSTGRRLRRLGRHKDTPLALAFSPNGEFLVSGGMDQTLLVYEAKATGDDLPGGDAADAEERHQWLHDLEDLRNGPSGNVSELADLAQHLALRNRTKKMAGPEGESLRRPMAGGGMAFL
eukprot:g13213.t1